MVDAVVGREAHVEIVVRSHPDRGGNGHLEEGKRINSTVEKGHFSNERCIRILGKVLRFPTALSSDFPVQPGMRVLMSTSNTS